MSRSFFRNSADRLEVMAPWSLPIGMSYGEVAVHWTGLAVVCTTTVRAFYLPSVSPRSPIAVDSCQIIIVPVQGSPGTTVARLGKGN